jgi:hypothetical protein
MHDNDKAPSIILGKEHFFAGKDCVVGCFSTANQIKIAAILHRFPQ